MGLRKLQMDWIMMMKLSNNQQKMKDGQFAKQRTRLSVLLCCLFYALFLTGCAAKSAEQPVTEQDMIPADVLLDPVNVSLDTAVVTRENLFDVITLDASIEPITQEVSFAVRGQIDKIHVHLGDQVTKGQVLATLETEEMEESIQAMQEDLIAMQEKHAYDIQMLTYQIEIDEQSRYFTTQPAIKADHFSIEEEKLTQKQMIERYALEEKYLQQKIDDALADKQKYQITAPIDGQVLAAANLYKGDAIEANDAVVVIAPSNPDYYLTCDFFNQIIANESYRTYALIHGKEYDVTYQPYSTDEQARLRAREQLNKSRFTINQMDEDIQLGDYALLCMIRNYKENVLAIPKDALFYDGSGYYVYLVQNEEKIRQPVSTGFTSPTMIEVKEGLQEGDVIYVKN